MSKDKGAVNDPPLLRRAQHAQIVLTIRELLPLGVSGHGKTRGIFTFADGHAKYLYHFNYPYSYSECVTMKDMTKLLMPKWSGK